MNEMEKILAALTESTIASRLIAFGMLIMLLAVAEIDSMGIVWDVAKEKEGGVFSVGLGMVAVGVVLGIIDRLINERPPKD